MLTPIFPIYIYIYISGVIGGPYLFSWVFPGFSNAGPCSEPRGAALRTIPLGSAQMSMEQLNKLITELIEVWLICLGKCWEKLAHVFLVFFSGKRTKQFWWIFWGEV